MTGEIACVALYHSTEVRDSQGLVTFPAFWGYKSLLRRWQGFGLPVSRGGATGDHTLATRQVQSHRDAPQPTRVGKEQGAGGVGGGVKKVGKRNQRREKAFDRLAYIFSSRLSLLSLYAMSGRLSGSRIMQVARQARFATFFNSRREHSFISVRV